MIPKDGILLRIFIGESDRHQGLPLYEWIVKKAFEAGMAGGYGVSRDARIRGK